MCDVSGVACVDLDADIAEVQAGRKRNSAFAEKT